MSDNVHTTAPQRRTVKFSTRFTADEMERVRIAAKLDRRTPAQWARLVLNTAAQLAIDNAVDADARTIARARTEP